MIFKLLFIITLLFSEDLQNFKINFLGFKVADVEFNSIDTLYNNQISTLITFKTHSTGIMSYLFNVNNNYKTILAKNDETILWFNKNTSQPGVYNSLETSRINSQTIYNNSSIIIPAQHHNIFSLLHYISQNKIINEKLFNIEREGILYSGKISVVSILKNNKILYDLELIEKESDNNPIVKNTDIFTWALFKKDTKKSILVDYNKNNIIRCTFTYNKGKMIADNIKYIK